MIESRYVEQLKSQQIVLKKLDHAGVCKARNEGLRCAKNDWIAYVDSDNTITKCFLGVFAKEIMQRPDVKNFYAQWRPIEGNGLDWSQHCYSLSKLMYRNFIDLGVYVHHRSLIDELGMFDEDMKRLVDWDLILRQCLKHEPHYIPCHVMNYNNVKSKDRITCSITDTDKWIKYVQEKNQKQYDSIQQKIFSQSFKQNSCCNKLNSRFFKIVIPNYNNMAYVKKCLDSVVSQTFKDFIAIVVDDVSNDYSSNMIKMYSRQYPNHFMFIQNSTRKCAGGARNAALDINLNTKYTIFLDSDDKFHDDKVLENLFNFIKSSESKPDIISCPYCINEVKKIYPEKTIDSIIKSMNFRPYAYVCKSSFDRVKFVENRPKGNDFVRCMKLLDDNDINIVSHVNFPVIDYNVKSITSCQHGINKSSIENDASMIKMIDDIKTLKFNKQIIQSISVKKIDNIQQYTKNRFKNRIYLNQFFSNSFIITIDDSKYKMLDRIWNSYFQDSSLKNIFYGSHNKKFSGPWNCAQSHINVITHAKNKDLPFACVFEDDAYPCIDCERKIDDMLCVIPKNADMIVLGWSNVRHGVVQDFSQPFNKITGCIYGSHAYIIFKSAYDRYLKWFSSGRKWKTADGMIYMNVGNAYVLNTPLFIQYSKNVSMNNHCGYIFYGDHSSPPSGFSPWTE